MKIHKYAEYFPALEGEEFNLLVEDIKKNGQVEAIVTYRGEILDGANRYRACRAAGVEPKYQEYTGDDPLGHVVSLNVRRRHMDVSQRAMLATEMLPEFEAKAEIVRREAISEFRKTGETTTSGSSGNSNSR